MAFKKKLPDGPVLMRAGWGDVREVVPDMVETLTAQGWIEVEEERVSEERNQSEETDETR